MQEKEIIFAKQAREKLKQGIDKLSDAVTSTLGPGGNVVILEKSEGIPVVTKDGVTVAKSIDLEDPVENIGAQILKQAAVQTADNVGDGTTTATLIAQELIHGGFTMLDNDINIVDFKEGINVALKDTINTLNDYKKEITTNSEIEQIGFISSNNDVEIGKIIAAAMEQVGRSGVIVVEESKSSETSLEIVEGMQFERGYLSPYFITNNAEFLVELDNPYILITDKKISAVKDILGVIEKINATTQRPILIIADDIDGEALATLIVNKVRGLLKVCVVKAPDYGDRRIEKLEDIATLTGGQVISDKKGYKLENVQFEQLGEAKFVKVTNKKTTIIDGAGEEQDIATKVNEINDQIKNATSDYERERIQERLAKFIGGVAVINVGAETELELKEKKDRLDDALHATKAAVEDGIIPGGGIILKRIGNECKHQLELTGDKLIGYQTFMRAIQSPFKIILKNVGIDSPDYTWKAILETNDTNCGFDARTKVVCNMYDNGIIDPVKVVKIALTKAVSVATTILSTNAVATLIRKKEDKQIMNPEMMY